MSRSHNEMNRLFYIDFLKVIGLIGIVIAHVGSPEWAIMMRNFDVPLMVILSSILAEKSYNNRLKEGRSVKSYYINRFKRLVFPTWIFLTVYFCLEFIIGKQHHDLEYYISSYCLTRCGIGYVWVILIYLYSAMVVPVFHRLKRNPYLGAIIICLGYVVYELAYYYQIGTQSVFLDSTVFYIIPYGLLTYLGFNYTAMKKSLKYGIMIIALFVFAALFLWYWLLYGTPQNTQIAKYPPRIYYLSYGVFVSFALNIVCDRVELKIFRDKYVYFISAHSMWIYLWHILFLALYPKLHFKLYPVEWTPIFLGLPILWTVFLG